MAPLGLYRPGVTWWHRTTAGRKLALLALWAITITVVRGPIGAIALVAVTLGVAAWAGLGTRGTWRSLRPLLLVLVLVGAYGWWSRGWQSALEVVLDLVSLVLASAVLTTTTPMDDLVDGVVALAGRLRRIGVSPERVGLAIGVMVRAVPAILEVARQTRDAARARGLERDPRALLVPLALRTVARARATGDALAARGLGDE